MIEEYIEDICFDLEIDMPKVSYDNSMFLTDTMMAMCDEDTIYIQKMNKPTPDLMFAIAHELRHIWQQKTDKAYFFDDYKSMAEMENIEAYNMQIAEIDANAYAGIVMVDFFHLKPQYKGLGHRVVKEIEKRIEQIV